MRKNWMLLTAAMLAATSMPVMAATDKTEEESSYLYGTLDLTYAQFYYGEIERIEPENPDGLTGMYDAENPLTEKGYEEPGTYDAVTSATNAKSKMFALTATEDGSDGSVNILGPTNVNVAISKDLYEDVQKAIAEGSTCSNDLITLVEAFGEGTEEVPAEYKVIGSDGTLSRTIGTTNVVADEGMDDADEENTDEENTDEEDSAEGAFEASITTNSPWGNYEITVEGLDLDINTVQGAILETEDGSLYGLQHLDNLWLQASEIAFSVKEFTDPHGNVSGYQKFADMPGKTITKITYLIANADDIEIDTNLYCKEQLPENSAVSGPESVFYSKAGTEIPVTFSELPDGCEYEIDDVILSRNSLEDDCFFMENGVAKLDASCKPGEYDLVFSNDNYADLEFTCLVESGLNETDFVFESNQLSLAENENELTVSDYLGAITSVTVNGEAVNGRGLGSVIFAEDGTINLDAATTSQGVETPVFSGSDSYELQIQANGYPDQTFTVEP